MLKPDPKNEDLAVLAVLAAAAREAEELIAVELDLDPAARTEADRRLKLFMRRARQAAR
jgi:predicted amidohydrolase